MSQTPSAAQIPSVTVNDAAVELPAAPQEVTSAADPRVDDALSRLAEVESLPLVEQVEVYADIHRRLAGVLSDPDSQA